MKKVMQLVPLSVTQVELLETCTTKTAEIEALAGPLSRAIDDALLAILNRPVFGPASGTLSLPTRPKHREGCWALRGGILCSCNDAT